MEVEANTNEKETSTTNADLPPPEEKRLPFSERILAREAFYASNTPAIIANRNYEIIAINNSFQCLFAEHKDVFIECFGDEANPPQAIGQPLDLYLEGISYRRALRKEQYHEAEVDVGGVKLNIVIRELRESDQCGGGVLLEWLRPGNNANSDAETSLHAVTQVIENLTKATTAEEAAVITLSAVKEAFGWAYGSYWSINQEEQALRFSCDVGRVNEAFHSVTASASFREGVGLSGRAWRMRDLVFVPDLGEIQDCCRRESAQQAGVKSGVCFPIISGTEVIGTMDFFSLEVLDPSQDLLNTLRSVGRLLSSTMHNLLLAQEQSALAKKALAFRTAVDCSVKPLMITDEDFVLTYINPAAYEMLKAQEDTLKKELPSFSLQTVVGSSIDTFHKNPSHQRRILSDPRNFPYATNVQVGDLHLELQVSALVEQGKVQGMFAEWKDISAERQARMAIESLLTSASSGDLSQRIDCEGWGGFLQTMAEGMNQLLVGIQGPLKDTQQVIEALSAGDLTQLASDELEGEFAQVAEALNESIANLRNVIGQIVTSGEQIGQTASELADGNAHLNSRTQQQAAALEQTAATVEELTGTVKQNADNAQSANKLAADARDMAEKGGEVVGRAVSAMAEINRSSKKISDIISVIDEIAFQTNLLALNAAVEAARAGEQGRGFAVVATEVRNLAQRSAGAAKEIKTLIKDSVEKVEDGSRLVDSSGQTLREIVDGVKQVSDLVAEIAAASDEQATSIEHVNKAVAQMDEMTQQNAAMVEEATAASSSMHDQALSLGEVVRQFDIGRDTPEPPTPPSPKVAKPVAKTKRKSAAVPPPAIPATEENSHDWDEF